MWLTTPTERESGGGGRERGILKQEKTFLIIGVADGIHVEGGGASSTSDGGGSSRRYGEQVEIDLPDWLASFLAGQSKVWLTMSAEGGKEGSGGGDRE